MHIIHKAAAASLQLGPQRMSKAVCMREKMMVVISTPSLS